MDAAADRVLGWHSPKDFDAKDFERNTKMKTTPKFNYSPVALLCAYAIFSASIAHAQLAGNALPTGGVVAAGQASISQTGAAMQVQQTSQRAVINWGTYNIGQNASVNYVQPSSTSSTLNRIANGTTEIAGRLQSNGNVFLLNANGVLFSPTAQVNVGGLAAAAATTNDADFMNGNAVLQNSAGGRVVNQGQINARAGGSVVLSGEQVSNAGTITAPSGQVSLLGTQNVRINLTADGLIQAQVNPVPALGDPSAANAANTKVENTGIISAGAISTEGGVVRLISDSALVIQGQIDASGANGGRIDATGKDITVAGASLTATGSTGKGGVIRVGGDFQGGAWRQAGATAQTQDYVNAVQNLSPLANATTLNVDAASTIDVRGKTQGGVAVLWSDKYTNAQGSILAAGTGANAKGGAIEVSSHGTLYRPAITKYDPGFGGTLLLDPDDLYVVTAYTGSGVNDSGSAGANNWTGFGSQSSGASRSEVLNTQINFLLNSGRSVLLTTVRDLYVYAPIVASATSTSTRTQLQLEAGRSIFINNNIILTGSQLGLLIIANNDAGGSITLAMRGSGSSIIKQGNGTISVQGSIYIFGNDSIFKSSSDAISLYGVNSERTLLINSPMGKINLGNFFGYTGASNSTSSFSSFGISGFNVLLGSKNINFYAAGATNFPVTATGNIWTGNDTNNLLANTTLNPFQPLTNVDTHMVGVNAPNSSTIMMILASDFANGSVWDQTPSFGSGAFNLQSGSGIVTILVPASTVSSIPLTAYSTRSDVLSSAASSNGLNYTNYTGGNLLVAYADTLPSTPSTSASPSTTVTDQQNTVVATSSSNSTTSTSSTPTTQAAAASRTASTTPVVVQSGTTTVWKDALFANADTRIAQNPSVGKLDECDAGGEESGACIAKSKVPVAAISATDKDDGTPAVPVQKRRALVIGNTQYTSPLSALPGTARDAAAISKTLQEQGFEVTVVNNASRIQMVKALNGIVKDAGADDSVLVYYAGHGHIHPASSAGYWLPADANIDDPSTWISNSDIAKFVGNMAAKQILLVSDSCFSGALTRESDAASAPVLSKNAILKRRSVVAISSGGEEPVGDVGETGNSPFTGELLKQLRGVKAGGEPLKAQAMLGTIRDAVTARYKQTPNYGALLSAGHVAGGEYLFERE